MSSFGGNSLPPASHWLTDPASWYNRYQTRWPTQELNVEQVANEAEDTIEEEDGIVDDFEAEREHISFTDLLGSDYNTLAGPLDSESYDPHRDQQTEPYYAPASSQHNRSITAEPKGKERATYPNPIEGFPGSVDVGGTGNFPEEDFEPYQMINGEPQPLDHTLPPVEEDTAGPSNTSRTLPSQGEDRLRNNGTLLGGAKSAIKKGIDKRDQGEVRMFRGQLQQREGPGAQWGDAVRIEDIRDELIAISRQWGAYNIQPEGGYDNNITCFCPGQENWAPDRAHRPPILFRFRKEKVQPAQHPYPWFHHNMRVISPDNHHMTFFPDCPMTISSEVHGFRLEAWRRLNPGMTNTDLLYRIPPQYREKSRGSLKMVDRYGLTGLTNKIWRWRPGAFVIPWEQRGSGGHVLRKFLLEKMDEQSKRDNDTSNLRDLTREELREFKLRLEANKEKQSRIKKQKREIERRNRAGQPVGRDLRIEEDSETEPEISDDEPDASASVSRKRCRDDEQENPRPPKRRSLAQGSVNESQVVRPPVAQAKSSRHSSNVQHGITTLRSPSLPQIREPNTSHLGKRRRDETEQSQLDEQDLPMPKRHLQYVYIPGAARPGKKSRRSAGTKYATSPDSRRKQSTGQAILQDEVAIETIMTFDPYAAFDIPSDHTSDRFASTSYPDHTHANVIKPTSTGFEGTEVALPQTPTRTAHDALQRALMSDDMPASNSFSINGVNLPQQQSRVQSPQLLQDPSSRRRHRLPSQTPDDPRQQLVGSSTMQPEDAIPPPVTQASQNTAVLPITATDAEASIGQSSATAPKSPSPAPMPRHYYRNKRPETQAEQQQIDHAMNHSRIYYMRALGQNPPVTVPRSHSFAEQYEGLAVSYRERWSRDTDLDPVLHEVVGQWSRGFGDWECNWEILGGRFGPCRICKKR